MKEIEPIPNVITIVGSIENEKDIDKLISLINGKAHGTADLAPNVSGLWEMDHLKQIRFTRKALEFTKIVLKENGYALYKVFQGEDTAEFINYLKEFFLNVVITKPDASRKQSSEIYILCKKHKKKITKIE